MNPKALPPLLRKPPWLKVRPPYDDACRRIRSTLSGLKLHTVCQEAACPNMAECFACGTATFLILGNICTRNCLYCNVAHGRPQPPDEQEISRLISAVKQMRLQYVVLTSVTRDDLPDGGAGVFADAIRRLRGEIPGCKIEVLIPDFQGNPDALGSRDRRGAGCDQSQHGGGKTAVLQIAPAGKLPPLPRDPFPRSGRGARLQERLHGGVRGAKRRRPAPDGRSRRGFLRAAYHRAISAADAAALAGCQILFPDEFSEFKEIAYAKVFKHVESGPLVRSSYHAARSASR